MRIVALADLHGRLPSNIPECDVLVLAGDIAPDYVAPRIGMYGVRAGIDPDYARVRQMEWLADAYASWEQQVPAKHIVATAGNHDWFHRMPDNCRTRLLLDASLELDGFLFYGTPWVQYCGEWNYLANRDLRKSIFADIPLYCDVLIAHSPVHKVGDMTHGGDHIGCEELRAAVYKKRPRVMFYGHCHEGGRHGREFRLGSTQIYHTSLVHTLPFVMVDLEKR